MSLSKRLEYHFRTTVWDTVEVATDAAERMTEGTSDLVKAAGCAAGFGGAAFVSSARAANPINIAKTVLVSDKEVERKLNEPIKIGSEKRDTD